MTIKNNKTKSKTVNIFSFIFKKSNIPNALTIFRIILTIIILLLIYLTYIYRNNSSHIVSHVFFTYRIFGLKSIMLYGYFFALLLFLIASITDFLDGYIARKYKWITDFGKIWDPVADKVLINSVVILFAVMNVFNVIVPIIFIFRDTIVESFRCYAASKGIIVSANIFGKLKTIFQMCALIIVFFFVYTEYQTSPQWTWFFTFLIQYGFLSLALFFSVFSGAIYVYQIWKYIKK